MNTFSTNNRINFIVHILHYFRDTLISEENLQLLPIDDSTLNYINTVGIFIDSEANDENVIDKFLMYPQKAFYETDTFYMNEK